MLDMLVVFTLAETPQSAMGVPGSLLWVCPLCFLFTILLIGDEAELIGPNHNQASWFSVSLGYDCAIGATDCIVTGGVGGGVLGRWPVL